MNEVEKKLYDYAQSVEWDFDKMTDYLGNGDAFTMDEYYSLKGSYSDGKIKHFINKFGITRAQSITLPIEDYDRLRKLEIKAEIKKLKRELKRL